VGKHNLHEFAYGGSSLISHFGPVHNPVNPEYVAGGSSGGSAAAVASGMCLGAIGTDTAGSIREPAALCGVVGMKPTYGLVSTEGIIPLSVSLDHAGPIARTVEDVAILLDVIAGRTDGPTYRAETKQKLNQFIAGIPKKYFFEGLDAGVELAINQAIDQLASLGAELRELDLPVSTDRTVQSAESYAYHHEMVAASPELYDPETLRRIRSGENITGDEYQNALRDLRKARDEITQALQEIDVLVTPTVPVPAAPIAPLLEDRSSLRPAELLLLRNTRPLNVWGLPAISIPCGFTSAGLPIGLQIAAAPYRDAQVLQIAYAFEQSQTVHHRS
jgi:Asp-tRNA(Asn)/Glu-tRNA(Gln) amidotransferase A subunit family amidase